MSLPALASHAHVILAADVFLLISIARRLDPARFSVLLGVAQDLAVPQRNPAPLAESDRVEAAQG